MAGMTAGRGTLLFGEHRTRAEGEAAAGGNYASVRSVTKFPAAHASKLLDSHPAPPKSKAALFIKV